MGFLFRNALDRLSLKTRVQREREMCWRWYFKSHSLKLCRSEKWKRSGWVLACASRYTHTHQIAIHSHSSFHNQQRKLSEYTSFIYFHSSVDAVHIHSFFRSQFQSLLSSLSFCWFISSLSFIIGESESTMINEVLSAVCKLCMFQMIEVNLAYWLASRLTGCLKYDGSHTYTYAYIHDIRRKRSHKTNQDLQATLHKLRFSKTW